MTDSDDEILSFLRAIDDELAQIANEGERLNLYLLGRSVLILSYGVHLMTKDVDVVYDQRSVLLAQAETRFGKDTPAARKHDLYLETVSSGLPPLPQGYERRSRSIPGDWHVLCPYLPEIHDLAASKLSRFHAKDREDLQILCDIGDLTVDGLHAAVESAFAFAADEEDDPKRKRVNKNLGIIVDYLEGRRKTL